ncbi:MAG: cell division protein ZapA [Hydrogenophaga sp.]|jgi:cell division protein ZapA
MNAAATTKQIEVQIMGQSYLLACPAGGESALIDAVERVDTTMCRIRDAGKVKPRERIAVLASLNLAFELSQLDADRLRDSAATASPANAATPEDTAIQARMEALVRRLDSALDSDGQLL